MKLFSKFLSRFNKKEQPETLNLEDFLNKEVVVLLRSGEVVEARVEKKFSPAVYPNLTVGLSGFPYSLINPINNEIISSDLSSYDKNGRLYGRGAESIFDIIDIRLKEKVNFYYDNSTKTKWFTVEPLSSDFDHNGNILILDRATNETSLRKYWDQTSPWMHTDSWKPTPRPFKDVKLSLNSRGRSFLIATTFDGTAWIWHSSRWQQIPCLPDVEYTQHQVD